MLDFRIQEEEVLGVGDDCDDSEDEKNIAQYMKLLKTQKGFQQAKGQLDSDLEDESEDDEEEIGNLVIFRIEMIN